MCCIPFSVAAWSGTVHLCRRHGSVYCRPECKLCCLPTLTSARCVSVNASKSTAVIFSRLRKLIPWAHSLKHLWPLLIEDVSSFFWTRVLKLTISSPISQLDMFSVFALSKVPSKAVLEYSNILWPISGISPYTRPRSVPNCDMGLYLGVHTSWHNTPAHGQLQVTYQYNPELSSPSSRQDPIMTACPQWLGRVNHQKLLRKISK